MPKKQHLYLFGTNESFGFEINRSVTLNYINQFVIEEESQTDIIQSHLEMYPNNFEWTPGQSVNPVKSYFHPISDLSRYVKKSLNDIILNAMKTAAILEDNETQNHFIFESSLLRPNAWAIVANRLGRPFHELRDRLLEFQKIKKIWNTHFSHTLKPLEHDGKNRFSKY